MTFLLDLNLLLALAWPSHVHHDPAQAWFERDASTGWATCPLTQLGFVRLSSNPAFSSDAVSLPAALSLLQDITAEDGHEFWPDDLDCLSAGFSAGIRMVGHRQVTDAYLLSLARANSGCLATLDRRISGLLPRSDRPNPHLKVVRSR